MIKSNFGETNENITYFVKDLIFSNNNIACASKKKVHINKANL